MKLLSTIPIDDPGSHYYSVLDFNGERLIYWNDNYSSVKSYCNGIEILSDSSATHNFSPFIEDGKVFALGGQDNWRRNQKIRDFGLEEFRDYTFKRQNLLYNKSESSWEKTKEQICLVPPYVHSDGLYLFNSHDGYYFNYDPYPVIDVLTPGYKSCVAWKSAEFDGQISITKANDIYYAYMRNNQAPKQRVVQVATSKELINWTARPVFINGLPDNVYCLSVGYDKNFYGLAPVVQDNWSILYLVKSVDGFMWNIDRELICEPACLSTHGELKNRTMPCNGITFDEDKIKFWLHHGYMGIGAGEICLREYEIDR